MKRIVILGGGVVGRLAKLMFPEAVVLEAAKMEPPESSFDLGTKYLWANIPELKCQPIKVITTIDNEEATFESATAYKAKVGKDSDMVTGWEHQFRHEQKGYMFRRPALDIQWGHKVQAIDWQKKLVICKLQNRPYTEVEVPYDHLISTIPLPIVSTAVGMLIPKGEKPFRSKPIYVWSYLDQALGIKDPTMYVDYCSDSKLHWYRMTICGQRVQVESLDPTGFDGREDRNGDVKVIRVGKIWQGEFEHAAVEDLFDKGIHCIGRFARWSPDDLTHNSYEHLAQLRAVL